MRTIHHRDLLPDEVLNGIAYNPNNGDIILTGKHWPVLYKIKVELDI